MKEINTFNKQEYELNTFSYFPSPKIKTVNQQHTNKVIYEDDISQDPADGIRFKNTTKSLIGIKTADCLPIYLRGSTESVFLHAGWRGIKEGILFDKSITEIKPLSIYIGPSIQVNAFEVKDDFYKLMPFDQFYLQKGEKLFFNLQACASSILKKHIPNAKQTTSKICTYQNHQFHSFRRDKTTLRNWHIYSSSV